VTRNLEYASRASHYLSIIAVSLSMPSTLLGHAFSSMHPNLLPRTSLSMHPIRRLPILPSMHPVRYLIRYVSHQLSHIPDFPAVPL
jgi:hypothetical protein